jgi:chaperonin GroES
MIQAINDYIIIEPIKESNVSKSGILISSSEEVAPEKGKVISVGSEVEFISIGDIILFPTYGLSKIKFEDKEYLIIKDRDIFAIIK